MEIVQIDYPEWYTTISYILVIIMIVFVIVWLSLKVVEKIKKLKGMK